MRHVGNIIVDSSNLKEGESDRLLKKLKYNGSKRMQSDLYRLEDKQINNNRMSNLEMTNIYVNLRFDKSQQVKILS